MPEPCAARQGRPEAGTGAGERPPSQSVAGAVEAQSAQGPSAPRCELSACGLWRRGRPHHAPSVVCGRASVCPLARPTGCLWTRWWPSSRRRSRPISERIRATTLPCCITASRRCCAAFRRCFLRPCWVSTASAAFDTHEHPLPTLLGRGYHSSTLSQFLGQLERVDAAEALMPALVPAQAGQIIYVDGHMIAYWSRRVHAQGQDHDAGPHHGGLASRHRP